MNLNRPTLYMATSCILLILFQFSSGHLDAQENFFGIDVPTAETLAEIASWDPAAGSGHIAVHYTFPQGYHQNDEPDLFTIKPERTEHVNYGAVLKAEPVSTDEILSYYDKTTVLLEFSASLNEETITLALHAHFQLCDEAGICLLPDSDYHEIVFNPASASAMKPDVETNTILLWNEEKQSKFVETESPGAVKKSISSLLLFALMAFVGGILLNIMPCVLPLLSVKTLSLVRMSGSNDRAILGHAWLYAAGIEVSFWVLAGIVILFQSSGKLMGWGFQFQSPVFVLILTAVIWVFALSMFDVFVIEAPEKGMRRASAASARGGYTGSFLTGIFAVLVATPCTAPFLGAALGFTFSQSPAVIVTIFSITGLGFGLPFLLLGIWPGVIKKIPKPGNWMNTVKEVTGFILLGTAVYLFTTFMKLAPGVVHLVLWWLLLLGVSSWLFGKARNPSAGNSFRIAGQIIAVCIVLTSGYAIVNRTRASSIGGESISMPKDASDRTVDFDETDLLRRIEGGESIFLEFTASWCTTCKLNQRIIRSNRIQNLMADRNIVHITGDLTTYDETLTRWLASFNRAGVPLYVLYRQNEEPHVFPEIINARILAREFERISY